MQDRRWRLTAGLVAAVLGALASRSALALNPNAPEAASLAAKEFSRPELSVSTSHVAAEALTEFPAGRREAWDRLLAVAGPQARIYFDPRSGTPSNIIAAIPLIPGSGIGNAVTRDAIEQALGRTVPAIDAQVVADVVSAFVTQHAQALGLDRAQLGPVRAVHVTPDLWHVRIPQELQGIPVRYGQIVATLSHGNMVLCGTEMWGNVRVGTEARITAEQALALGFDYVGGRTSGDELWSAPHLELVPFAQGQAGEAFVGPVGEGYGHALVWVFGFRRAGELGSFELLLDAGDGTVLAFEDQNRYESEQIRGGVYPLTSTEICPTNATCGVMQPDQPMPFANTGLPAPNDFTNSAGLYENGAGAATTTLDGKFVRILDQCGPVSETGATGAIALGGVNGEHDCTSDGASPGDTAASRSGFYELNKLIEMARGWLPGNPWLSGQITSNMNLAQTCNAYYDYSTINFFLSGGGCRNTGELAAVFDHEWGHALDDNDSGGVLSNSSEAYADIAAIYRLRASCVGHGFFWTYNSGCGLTADGTGFNANESQTGTYCDTDCSGVRDVDWARHAANTPASPLGFVCTHCAGGSGPCGRQVHCAAAPSRQAAWDLVARDLQAPPFNMTRDDAFNLGAKIYFQGSGNIGEWHACTCGGSSNGCGAANAYTQWLAADDDDGNLNNGTPHMTAIFAAFDRHGIACPTPTPTNSGCAGGPTTAPVVTASPGSNQVGLNWSVVPGASSYRVLRTEGHAGCDLGQAVIAEVAGTSFTDGNVANSRGYYYIVQPVGASGACSGPGSACLTAVPLPCAGAPSTDRSVYNCSDVIDLRLSDVGLVGAGSQTVTVRSTVETILPETVMLVESPPGSGTFVGTIQTTAAPAVPDGLISVAHAASVTIEYVDASACGVPNVIVDRMVAVDCAAPQISGVLATSITDTDAAVHWLTNEPGDSRVLWGEPLPPTNPIMLSANVTTHDVSLQNLEPCRKYYFSVETRDAAGNVATDDAGGAYYRFTTQAAYGAACHLGSVAFDRDLYGCNDLIGVTLADIDLNLDPGGIDTIAVPVTSSNEVVPETVTLTELNVDSGLFYGAIPTGPLPVVPGDGVVQAGDVDMFTATYHDADTGIDGPAITTALASADCGAPLISDIIVTPWSDDLAEIAWTTSEGTYGYVEFGPTPAYGAIAYEDGWLSIQHSALVSGLFECERTYFRIVATDFYGSTGISDNGGSGLQFNAWTLPGAVYKQDFEGNHGWTLTGEWQAAAPHGLGSDRPDPTAAEHGVKVLGLDLTGLGAHTGDYEVGQTSTATSPIINTSTVPNLTARFRRWLNTDPGAQATFEVYDGEWLTVFQSEPYGCESSAWELVSYNLLEIAEGSDEFRMRFTQSGGVAETSPESGWNVDRIELRNGAVTPLPQACGGCSGTPSFGGLASATDLDGCAATGIGLTWAPAVAWGTGTTGTYSVYRGTSASFVPSAANRIATGLQATAFTDVTAPTNTALYYVVRAESNETCGGGSNNGGATDSNLLRKSARDDTSQPAPGAVGDSLRVTLTNQAHVHLTWTAAPGAAGYRVFRAGAPTATFVPLADAAQTAFDDLNRATISVPDFYLIRAVDSCGNAGP